MSASNSDLALKQAFHEEIRTLCLVRGKITVAFCIFLVPLFYGLDYVLAPDQRGFFLFLRLLNTVENLFLFGLLYVLGTRFSMRAVNGVMSICLGSLGLMIAIMCRLLGGYESSYYAGINLVLLGMCVLMPWPWQYAIWNSFFLCIVYLVVAYTPNFPVNDLINNNYFLWSMAMITVASSYWSHKLRFREFVGREELKAANAKLMALDAMKSRLISNVTHEFRTPLVSLSTALEIIEEKGLTSPDLVQDLVRSGKVALDDMMENINELLDKMRSAHGMLEMKWGEVELVEYVSKIVQGFAVLAERKGIALCFDSQCPPPFFMHVDRLKLKRILNNLIGNAIKFTPSGKVEVAIRRAGETVQIAVSDTGIGILPGEFEEIFEPFTQGSNNPWKDAEGTGIGLSLVRDFVARHGGTVAVESEVERGSVFTVTLPLSSHSIDRDKQEEGEALWDSDEPEFFPLSPRGDLPFDLFPREHADPNAPMVLIVEDNAAVMRALSAILSPHYTLYFAEDGEAGLREARLRNPHLVVTDIMMPRRDGYELIRTLKEDPDLKMTPIIALTAKADLASRVMGFEEGVDDYIAKPFHGREVLSRVKALIERRKRELEFIHAEKLIALGQLVAGVAHEINNPIAYAMNAADSIQDIFEAIERREIPFAEGMARMACSIRHIQEGTMRVANITQALQGMVRQGAAGFQAQDIHDGLNSTILIVETSRESPIRIHKAYALGHLLVCNMNQLNQVFLNILHNAVQALDEQGGGDIWIETSHTKDMAQIAIRDNGPGIPEREQRKIFDPFFTTKALGKGTGLGLYISQQIVHEHGGSLRVESKRGEGARFTITLPLAGPGAALHDEKIDRGPIDRGAGSRFTHITIDRHLEDVRYPDSR